MKAFITVGLALVLALPAFSKVESRYRVDVVSENSISEAEFLTYLNGWSCSASTSVSYYEYAKNHAGKMVRVPKRYNDRGTWSTFLSGGRSKVSMNFVRDLYNSDPTVGVYIQEDCSKTITESVWKEVCDTVNEKTRCQQKLVEETTTKEAYIGWACQFSQLPTRIGQDSEMKCQPSASGFYDMDAYLTAIVRKKEIFASIKLISTEQSFARDFCRAGEEKNATILHFEQGTGGHSLEDDYELDVRVNGEIVHLKSRNGIYSEDIRLCPSAEKEVTIGIKAYEKDLVWDDQYVADNDGQVSVSLKAGSIKEVTFNRRSYTAHIFTPKRSVIRIKTLK